MWDDPIVAETRQIRDQIAVRYDYNIWALGEYFKSKRTDEVMVLLAQSVAQPEPQKARSARSSKPSKRKKRGVQAQT